MKAKPESVRDIFGSKCQYIIPIFQRHYVWERTNQWEPLWEDLISQLRVRLDGRVPKPHYCGAIVIDERKKESVAEATKFSVIDGQQRLTTFQIILCALRDASIKQGASDLIAKLGKLIFNAPEEGVNSDPADEVKVRPTKFDRTPFFDILNTADREKIRQKYYASYKANTSGRSAAKQADLPRTIESYLFFYDMISKLLASPRDTFGTDTYDSDEIIESLADTFFSDFQTVVILLDSTDDAQVIFESLNYRGAPLLASDLIRNYAFMRAEQNRENVDEIYAREWSHFEDKFWAAEDRQGRLKKPRMEFFFANFLAAATGTEINQSRIFQEYLEWINFRKHDLSVSSELQFIFKHAFVYRTLVDPIGDSDLPNFAKFLSAFDFTIAFPLVMAIFVEDGIDADEKADMLLTLESYIVRRSVCGRTTKGYNKIFLQAVRDLRAKGINPRGLRDFFSGLKGESGDWPTDEQFHAAFVHKPLYALLTGQRLVYILSRLEYAERSKYTEIIKIDSQLTVEHVLPQSWCGAWPLANGRQVNEEQFEQANKRALLQLPLDALDRAITERENSVNTVGNLTLIVGRLNSSIGRSAFDVKRDAILQHSSLRLNRYFQTIDDWDEARIFARAEALVRDALDVWRGPKVSLVPGVMSSSEAQT